MPDDKTYLEIDKLILGDAYTSNEPGDNLLVLCDEIGPRLAGTHGERDAARFVADRLKSYGLDNVADEAFDYAGWHRGEPARLNLLQPAEREFPCISLPYCPPTGPDGVAAEIINLGDGAPEAFKRLGGDIRGKIVYVSSRMPPQVHRWVHRGEKYGRAVRAGAVGFIFVNHYDGLLPATGALRFGKAAEIPGIGIARETGEELLRRSKGCKPVVRIITSDTNEPKASCNVVGELTGTQKPEEIIVVGGHYDSHDLCTSANDNAAGLTVVLETARLLAAHRQHLARTVRFIAFGCEEIGLIGSHEYVAAHRDEMPNIRVMFNSDCLTNARPKGLVFHAWPQAEGYVEALAEQLKTPIPFGDIVFAYSDHFPFLLHGVPTANVGNLSNPFAGRGWGHTAADTPDKVSLVDQRESAALLARMILRVANDDEWPLQQRSREEVEALLEAEELIEILDIEDARSLDDE